MDNEAKKLFNAKAWAIDAPTNRAELNDPSITPQIVREDGWDASFSQTGGNLPDRRHFNQILCETSSAAKEVLYGVSAWQNDVDYPVNAITKVQGTLWIASVATGPTTSNAISPTTANQNVWLPISGSRAIPDAPESFVGTPGPQNIVVQWKAGEDNGDKITRWNVEHKEADQDWNGIYTTVQYPYINLTNLSAGAQYKVRVAAINDTGTGPWGESPVGGSQFTTVGRVPNGGDLLALLATAGDATVDLTWSVPDDGGYDIINYTIEWMESTQSWAQATSTTSTTNAHTVPNLKNGVTYLFRVKASNLKGGGDWSNVATARPVSSAIDTYAPTLLAPTLRVTGTTSINAQPNDQNSVIGRTATIMSYTWSIKRRDDATWTDQQATTSKSYDFTNLEANTVYEVRFSVTTALGVSTHSPVALGTTLSASTPNVIRVQPTLLAPSASRSGRGASVAAQHTSDGAYGLYTIQSTTWQYRRVGHTAWATFSGTNSNSSIPYPTIDTDTYAYEFRFRYHTSGGETDFSPVKTLARKTQKPGQVRNLKILPYVGPWYNSGYRPERYITAGASWSTPAGSAPVTHYQVTFQHNGRQLGNGIQRTTGTSAKSGIGFYDAGDGGQVLTVWVTAWNGNVRGSPTSASYTVPSATPPSSN